MLFSRDFSIIHAVIDNAVGVVQTAYAADKVLAGDGSGCVNVHDVTPVHAENSHEFGIRAVYSHIEYCIRIAAELTRERVIHIGAYAGYCCSLEFDISAEGVILVPRSFVICESDEILRCVDDYAVLKAASVAFKAVVAQRLYSGVRSSSVVEPRIRIGHDEDIVVVICANFALLPVCTG